MQALEQSQPEPSAGYLDIIIMPFIKSEVTALI
jgi:hypothetical protein